MENVLDCRQSVRTILTPTNPRQINQTHTKFNDTLEHIS